MGIELKPCYPKKRVCLLLFVNAKIWGVWISSQARELAKPSRWNSKPKMKTLLPEGSPREEMSRKIGNQGSLKEGQIDILQLRDFPGFFLQIRDGRSQNEVTSGTVSRARVSARVFVFL